MPDSVQPSHKIPLANPKLLSAAAKDLAKHLNKLFSKYGEIVCFSRRGKLFAIGSPEAVSYMSKANHDNYDKFFNVYNRLQKMFGRGVLTLVGKEWRHRRKTLQPYFTHKSMPDLTTVAVEKTQQLIKRWEGLVGGNEPIDMNKELLACVLQISLKALFSEDISFRKAQKITHYYTAALRTSYRSLLLKPWFPSWSNFVFYKMQFLIGLYCRKLIRKRRSMKNPPQDFLTNLLAAVNPETGKRLSDKEIRAEISTFMATGHETTGHALGWTMMLLMQHPEHMKTMEQELDQVLAGRVPTHEDLKQLPFNRMVFQEGLRMYPTIWSFGRRALKEDVLCGYKIPKGSTIIVCPYAFHRLENYWSDPDVFNPHRFAGSSPEPSHRYAYIPFGAGPHTCIANQFSMVIGQVVLAMLKQRFNFELMSDFFDYELFFTIKAKYPVYIKVTERESGCKES